MMMIGTADTMPITAKCPRCGYTLEAENADQLVDVIRAHVRNEHRLEHELPRKHVIAMLRKQGIDASRADDDIGDSEPNKTDDPPN